MITQLAYYPKLERPVKLNAPKKGGKMTSKAKISLLIPTRQRPEMLKRVYDSAFNLASHPGLVELIYYVDNDDKSYDDLNLYNATKVSGPRDVLSKAWNCCYDSSTGEIVWHGGDDNIFRTESWDDVVRDTFEEYPDRIAFIWGNDGNGESERNGFATHGFLHKNWVDTVGRFLPPYFVSDYNDTWLNEIAHAIDRHRHIDIMIEHMHFSLGKSEKDQNTTDRLTRHSKENPEALYSSQKLRIERLDEIEKLRQFIENYKNLL